jgi:inner membrane protein
MDTLTHALSGALLARATWHKDHALSLRQRTQAGFLTAAFPDIDYITRLTTDNFLVYLNYHRGITHSLLLLPLWALLLSLILSRLLKPAPDWRSLYLVCCLGLGIHIAGDVITSYGTMIFSPITNWRASLDTTFIIDPIFTGIIITALLGSFLYKHRQRAAAAGLVALIFYLGLQTWAHQRALQIGEQAAMSNRWRDATISAIPQPLSPFHWKIIVEHKEHYHVALVRQFGQDYDLSDEDGFFLQLWASYQPHTSLVWRREDRYGYDRYKARLIKTAWYSDANADFRRFARFPALSTKRQLSRNCHWFSDLRFVIPGRTNTNLFTFSVCPSATPGGDFRQPTD